MSSSKSFQDSEVMIVNKSEDIRLCYVYYSKTSKSGEKKKTQIDDTSPTQSTYINDMHFIYAHHV